MRTAVIGAVFLVISTLLQYVWIKVQRSFSIMQAQKSYGVGIDVEIKASTPSMGGVVFLVLSFAALLIDLSVEGVMFWSLPIAGGLIGLVDDGKKFFSHSSEGFRSMAKLKVQLAVCAVWSLALMFGGRLGLWPGLPNNRALSFLLAFLGSAGMMNAVNITDGLDGLACGCFMISLAVCAFLLPLTDFNGRILTILFFIAAGFMIYNIHPASTFMGDTGAHLLGGALASLCIINGRTLALIPVGFMFGLEILSSAIQIFTIRKFNIRVFRMAPLHHHFQLSGMGAARGSGWPETTVTMRFWLAHAVGAVLFSLLLMAAGAD